MGTRRRAGEEDVCLLDLDGQPAVNDGEESGEDDAILTLTADASVVSFSSSSSRLSVSESPAAPAPAPRPQVVAAENLQSPLSSLPASSNVGSTSIAHAHAEVAFTFDSIHYSVKPPGEWPLLSRKPRKEILRDISGCVRAGETLAIMGPSGSGKSTLLDILADRKQEGTTTGQILFNGAPRTEHFKRFIGYVTQENTLIESLTVREVLWYTALLRLEPTVAKGVKEARIEEVVRELNLAKVIDSTVGGHKRRGLSGGEKKRVSIGVELIANPWLLFLDEATTGLDSKTASDVMDLIIQLSRSPQRRAVIFTIHQPRSNIVKKFDKLLLLSHGRVVFNGPFTLAKPFFESIAYPCEADTNPADYLLDIANDSAQSVERIEEAYRKTDQFTSIKREIAQFSSRVHRSSVQPSSEYANSALTQTLVLARRDILSMVRDPALFASMLVQAVFFGIVIGSLWSHLTSNRALTEVNALFFIATTLSMAAWSACPHLILFRTIYNHERASGMYRVSAYMIGKTIADVPILNIHTTIFCTLMYWLVGLSWSKYFYYILLCNVFSFTCVSIVTFCSAISKDVDVALVVTSGINGLASVFAGFFVPVYNIPSFWKFMYYASYQQHGLSGFIVNNFEDCDVSYSMDCNLHIDAEETLVSMCNDLTSIKNMDLAQITSLMSNLTSVEDSCNIIQGNVANNECTAILVQVFGESTVCAGEIPNKWDSLLVVLSVALVFRLLTYFVLRLHKWFLKNFY